MTHHRIAARLAILPVLLLFTAGCDRMQRQRESEGDGAYAQQLADAIPRVEKATGMTFKRPPSIAARSRADVRAFLVREFESADTRRDLDAKETIYKRLGGIPESMNLREFLTDVLEEQIVGYYDPKRDTLYVVSGIDRTITGGVILHELVHALQDQYVNLDSILRQKGDDDRVQAAQAVLEGQATFDGMNAMTGGGLINATTNWDVAREQIRDARASLPKLANAPTLISESLIFPYLTGAEFVRRHRERRPTQGVLAELPTSTEQVLHAPSWFDAARDVPSRVRLADVAGVTWENTIGEFETRVLLYEQLREVSIPTRAAIGWDGDRIALAGDALVWATTWDTPVDAAEFHDAVTKAMALRYGAAAPGDAMAETRRFTAKERTVTVSLGDVSGRPVVLLVDMPAGAALPATLANVRVEADAGR